MFHHSSLIPVRVCERGMAGLTVSVPLFQGGVGSPGNGTAGCPGFQVCDGGLECAAYKSNIIDFPLHLCLF